MNIIYIKNNIILRYILWRNRPWTNVKQKGNFPGYFARVKEFRFLRFWIWSCRIGFWNRFLQRFWVSYLVHFWNPSFPCSSMSFLRVCWKFHCRKYLPKIFPFVWKIYLNFFEREKGFVDTVELLYNYKIWIFKNVLDYKTNFT